MGFVRNYAFSQILPKVLKCIRQELKALLLCVYTVVLWRNLLGDFHWREDSLPRGGPSLPSQLTGEWAQAGKAEECCML